MTTGMMLDHDTVKEYVFFIYFGLNMFATIVIFIFVKETRGLSEEQVAKLYVRDKTEIMPEDRVELTSEQKAEDK